MFLAAHGATLVLWIHILAACIWIGGQIALGALVPMLRGDRALLSAAARRFQAIAWPAFALLLITGVANTYNAGISLSDLPSTPRGRTLELKLAFVFLSGLAAALHAFVVGPRASAGLRWARPMSGLLGALSLLAAMAAALYGVLIAEA